MGVDYNCAVGWGVMLSEVVSIKHEHEFKTKFNVDTGDPYTVIEKKEWMELNDGTKFVEDYEIHEYLESRDMNVLYSSYDGLELDTAFVGKFEGVDLDDFVSLSQDELEAEKEAVAQLLSKYGVKKEDLKFITYFYCS
jgi:hypothetical protein